MNGHILKLKIFKDLLVVQSGRHLGRRVTTTFLIKKKRWCIKSNKEKWLHNVCTDRDGIIFLSIQKRDKTESYKQEQSMSISMSISMTSSISMSSSNSKSRNNSMSKSRSKLLPQQRYLLLLESVFTISVNHRQVRRKISLTLFSIPYCFTLLLTVRTLVLQIE